VSKLVESRVIYVEVFMEDIQKYNTIK